MFNMQFSIFLNQQDFSRGPEKLSRYSDSLRAGRSEDRIPVGARLPHTPRPAVGPTQRPIKLVPGLFSEGLSGRNMALTINPHQAPRLKKEKSYTSTSPLGLHGLF